jgi:hypothetical protein
MSFMLSGQVRKHVGTLVLMLTTSFPCRVWCQQTQPAPKGAITSTKSAPSLAFRDGVDTPPATQRHFRLSHSYPQKYPGECEDCKWLKLQVDFGPHFPSTDGRQAKAQDWQQGPWQEYLRLLLEYVKEGQDPNLVDDVGFRTTVHGRTRWFNVPWMAYDLTVGREYLHGTTNERTARLSELTPGSNRLLLQNFRMAQHADSKFRGAGALALMSQPTEAWSGNPYGYETWSVGFYNEWGGYSMGKAFPSTGKPVIVNYLGSKMPDGLPFQDGTAVVKILTTTADADCVPALRGAPEWRVNRHVFDQDKGYQCQRAVQTTRVLQVDIAAVDHRSPTRWVYGTFAYDGTRMKEGDTFWDRLVPVGVQWGADPWSFPAVPHEASLPLQQTVLNPQTATLMSHYGCPAAKPGEKLNLYNQRLSGPVDNEASSCISCHSSAYAAPPGSPSTMGTNVPNSFGFDGMCQQYSLDNASYFQNQLPPQHFPGGRFPDSINLDTSLQLEVAFDQYGTFVSKGKPVECDDKKINQVVPNKPRDGSH